VLVTLTGSLPAAADAPAPVDVLVLNDALDRLAAQDARMAEIVELHFFGGLTGEETGEALGLSTRTVERQLRAARAWLCRDLEGGA
jgi:RNA polymerase sigma factor (sigma-70 family)